MAIGLLAGIDYRSWASTIDLLNNPWKLEYVEIDDSLFFTKGLRGGAVVLGALDVEEHEYYVDNKLKPDKGEHRSVDGIEIVLMGYALGYVLENARMRSGPGTEYPFYKIDGDIAEPADI